MAQHLTPTELARELGIARRAVLEQCVELGVPVYQGRIDRTLFCTALHTRDAQADTVMFAAVADDEELPAGRRERRALH